MQTGKITRSEDGIVSVRGDAGHGRLGENADPITTEVIRHGLNAAAGQMAVALKRTAFSPVIYEVNDFACALYDRHGPAPRAGSIFPLFLGTLEFCIELAVRPARGGGARAGRCDLHELRLRHRVAPAGRRS